MIKFHKLTTGYSSRGTSKEISRALDLSIEKGTLVGILGSNTDAKYEDLLMAPYGTATS